MCSGKEWCALRFTALWGMFLKRPESKNDPHYASIRTMHDQVAAAQAVILSDGNQYDLRLNEFKQNENDFISQVQQIAKNTKQPSTDHNDIKNVLDAISNKNVKKKHYVKS